MTRDERKMEKYRYWYCTTGTEEFDASIIENFVKWNAKAMLYARHLFRRLSQNKTNR